MCLFIHSAAPRTHHVRCAPPGDAGTTARGLPPAFFHFECQSLCFPFPCLIASQWLVWNFPVPTSLTLIYFPCSPHPPNLNPCNFKSFLTPRHLQTPFRFVSLCGLQLNQTITLICNYRNDPMEVRIIISNMQIRTVIVKELENKYCPKSHGW